MTILRKTSRLGSKSKFTGTITERQLLPQARHPASVNCDRIVTAPHRRESSNTSHGLSRFLSQVPSPPNSGECPLRLQRVSAWITRSENPHKSLATASIPAKSIGLKNTSPPRPTEGSITRLKYFSDFFGKNACNASALLLSWWLLTDTSP